MHQYTIIIFYVLHIHLYIYIYIGNYIILIIKNYLTVPGFTVCFWIRTFLFLTLNNKHVLHTKILNKKDLHKKGILCNDIFLNIT